MDGHFSARKTKKEERHKLMLDAHKEKMEWDRTKTETQLQIEREKTELEKQEGAIKWELQKAKTFGDIELEKDRLQLSHDAEDAKIMLADEFTLNEHAKKWLVGRKKETNDRRALETARAAMNGPAEQEARMQAAIVARMHAEEARM
ncbi:hypothetical protein D1007_51604 [Hordeum vulgare]|nr:hypothetical protein D1007_51604 [Hordeum vulgare]